MANAAYLFAQSATDDAAYVALADLAELLKDRPAARIIGGHAVSLLSAAFPASGMVERRTGDADAGIPVELADTGELHVALESAGYSAVNSNRYVKDGWDPPAPTIDVLIPSLGGHFRPEVRAGREFDAMPGLNLALGDGGIPVDTVARLRDGTELAFTVTVPEVELMVVLKAIAWAGRGAQGPKDAIDLANLFAVADNYDAADIGGWRLGETALIGARKDAAASLHRLADHADAGWLARTPIDARLLTVRIRRRVTRP
ncbi:nucleotidyl transferase AbiEii/AbiGii toxin family protein [Gryllotalpicola kribbensis]|uniref:Nucleotidyl transferase AbiEii/AbiGii toxin family protein n=1 Tax=Gryllotalpicola kribbensis TaxID=993084 RepID=A0ABP8AUN4_9MICO